MKALIIDPSGMVGHVVALYFKEQGHDVTGYGEKSLEGIKMVNRSIRDLDHVEKIVNGGNFDAIINCSAIINDNAERHKEEAVFVNAYFPHYLEKITRETKTVIVHRSTDCIFSGKRGHYNGNDFPDATSFYARTKSIGELNNEKDITIRTSLIGPDYDKDRNDLFNWFFYQRGDVNGFANSIWTGLTTIEFAKEIEQLLLQRAHGLFQLVPDDSISKFDLLRLFEKCFPSGRIIHKVENQKVDKSLIQEKKGLLLEIPSYDNMIEEMAIWVNKHKDFYKNYCA